MPIKSTPKYMQAPNAEMVAIPALMLPRRPSQGFDLTQSVIMQVTATKADRYMKRFFEVRGTPTVITHWEYNHDEECRGEVGDDRAGVFFHLVVQGPRGEHRYAYVFEGAVVLGRLHVVEEGIFPRSPSRERSFIQVIS